MKKILNMEDEIILQEAVKAILRGKYKLVQTTDGQKGLKLFAKQKFDLVLLDLNMPFNGIDVLKEIGNKGVPIIVYSNMNGSMKKEAMNLGAKEYLIKSDTSSQQLVECIERNLK